MKVLRNLAIFLSVLPAIIFAQNPMLSNPLLVHSNSPLPYDKIRAADIKDAVSSLMKVCDRRIKILTAIPAAKKTTANTLMAFDEISYDLVDLNSKLGMIASTYSDDDTRNEANNQVQILSSYASDLSLNKPLYLAIKQYGTSATARTLSAPQKKFLRETLISFEINGMKLDDKGRMALKKTNDKLINFGNQFDKNIAEFKDSVRFSLNDLKGVPEQIIQPWKRGSGSYMVTVNGPNSSNLLKYADIEATRHTAYLKYQNRAYPANMAVLDSLFFYRQQLADELGYKTFAEYALVTKMAAKPANVWHFLDDLKDKLAPGVGPELMELQNLKKEQHPDSQNQLMAWDINYYTKKLLDTRYKLNTDEVKQYFEMNNTIQGMFDVYQKLFNIRIKETKGVPVWNPKVRSYEMYMDGKKMGVFFLDLYPRPNKYTHFETSPLSQYRIANGKEVLPVGTLICNFPEATATEPSLLAHSDVVTMFHEFGHLIHFIVGRPIIASQSLYGIKGDFIEAPSQFLENFCWSYDCLKLFAKNYKTGQVLPLSLFNKMKAAQDVGVSILNMRQVSLAMTDFTYEDRYNSVKDKGIDQVEKDVYAITQIPYPEGSHFICSFTHLNSYGANYYGYLWSKVYAQDLFSVFEKNGVLDQATGVRYRKDILEKGATEDEMAMLRHFLGREPNSKAFLKSLGIKQ